ncbi:MAG: alpha/beta fold hydrolase [Deltaproteobacteria bacterium]|nr:alpha/beta fold hydrolase [Deltaproteobacteria bacterium]
MIAPASSDSPLPVSISTARGLVEYASAGQGPTVLALHGAMGGWDQSMILARTLDLTRFRAVALSRPGYLGTALAAGRSADQQADLYAATLDALGLERVAVLAVSGGGPSALRFALRHPARCWALVLVSSIGEPMRGRLPLSARLAMWLGRQAWFAERLRRRLARDPEAPARRAILDPALRARTLDDPEAGPLFRALLASTTERLPLRIEGTRQDVRAGRAPAPPLEDVRVPTLVVHGTADRTVPFARHGAALARRIPGAELLALEGGEHVALFTHRALIKPRMDAFLRAHAPAPVESEVTAPLR